MLDRDELKKIGNLINSEDREEREAARQQVRILFAQLDSEDKEEQRAAQSALMAMGPEVHSFYYSEQNRMSSTVGSDDPQELVKLIYSRHKEEREESQETVRRWMRKLDSEDKIAYQEAYDDLLAMGPDAFRFLVKQLEISWAKQIRGGLLQILVEICNNHRIDDKSALIKKMQWIAKDDLRTNDYSVLEQSLARKSLKKWNADVPKEEVRHCHKCRKTSKKDFVRTCARPGCTNCMCEEHAIVRGDERHTKWYCSSKHIVGGGLKEERRY